jgi:methylated-DNA-[protein]-cysteine S-methyltransferase
VTRLVRYAIADAGFARVLVADAGRGVCMTSLAGEDARGRLREGSGRWEPEAELAEDAAALDGAIEQLVAYGAGERRDFELELDPRGSEFDRAVWRELARIPWGATRTSGEIAERVGRPGGARAVGGAAGRNPIPVIIPCHRVLAANGPGGFTGGLHHKRRLLALEGVPIAIQDELALPEGG